MFVIAAIVTHRRPTELKRLLDSLGRSTLPLAGCVISDHAPGGGTADLARTTPFTTVVLDDASNPGPGTGWANAARAALERFPKAEAIWFLDDDVVVAPGDLGVLLEEMGETDAIAPLLEDDDGNLWAFPEPAPVPLRRTIRGCHTPSEALERLGGDPIPFCWCTGACFLVRRGLIEQAGWHRGDFWMLGEDLEFSMRMASAGRAVFTCKVSVPHRPPPATDAVAARKSDYRKFCSLLQNLTYLAFHSPHSRHMKSYLPGNYRRFFRTHGLRVRTVRDAVFCFCQGALMARPAGTPAAARLRDRISHHAD